MLKCHVTVAVLVLMVIDYAEIFMFRNFMLIAEICPSWYHINFGRKTDNGPNFFAFPFVAELLYKIMNDFMKFKNELIYAATCIISVIVQ